MPELQKKLFKCELGGIFFVLTLSVIMQNLYQLTNHNLLGVMFGAVNGSIWELTKTLIFPFLLWSILELLSIRPPFYQFVVSKTISLYVLGVIYILYNLFCQVFLQSSDYLPAFIGAVVCVSACEYLSYRLVLSDYNLSGFFAPALFLLLLFISFYISFTPFPPHIFIFADKTTGLYGIIPDNIDIGAIILDTFYGFN